MIPLVFGLAESRTIAEALCERIGGEMGEFEHRRFPDGESYVRVDSPVSARPVIICSTLHEPDAKLLPIRFLAGACREMEAPSVGLVAPYLAYMRQDKQFRRGEAVTSRLFAALLSPAFDWIVTVDPHLHRIHDLNDVYTIPAKAVRAAPAISEWIRRNVKQPLLIGPDEESEQWVSEIARSAGAPWIVLKKTRKGDRDVSVSVPDVARWLNHTPVLADDIISTARTMIQTLAHLKTAGMPPAVCIGVHAVFAGDAFSELKAAGPAEIVTCNTIPHETNGIDVTAVIAEAVRGLL